jgi:hypothetical protein
MKRSYKLLAQKEEKQETTMMTTRSNMENSGA